MASICHISLNVVFIGNRYQKEAVHYIGYDFLHYIHTFLSGPQHLHLPISYPTFPINPARVHGNNRQRLWSHLCGLEVFLLDALHLHLPEDFGLGVWLAQVAVVNDAWFPQKTCVHLWYLPEASRRCVCRGEVTGRREGRKLVEEVRVLLLAAHSGHGAHIERQISDQPAARQLIQLQDVLHIVDIVDQQVTLIDTRDKSYRRERDVSILLFCINGILKLAPMPPFFYSSK